MQLAGGLLSGRYSKADMEKEQEGRFWTIGGERFTKMYVMWSSVIELIPRSDLSAWADMSQTLEPSGCNEITSLGVSKETVSC